MRGDGGDRAAANNLAKLPHLLSLSRRAGHHAERDHLALGADDCGGADHPGHPPASDGALLQQLSSLPVIANSAQLIGVKEQDK
jgi:hypothetical protein